MGSSPTKQINLSVTQPDIYETANENDRVQEETQTERENPDRARNPNQDSKAQKKKKKFVKSVFHVQLAHDYVATDTAIYLHPYNWEWTEEESYELELERREEVAGTEYFLYGTSIAVPSELQQTPKYYYSITTKFLEEIEPEEVNNSSNAEDAEEDTVLDQHSDDQEDRSLVQTDVAKEHSSGNTETERCRREMPENNETDAAKSTQRKVEQKQYKESYLSVKEENLRQLRMRHRKDNHWDVYDGVVPFSDHIRFEETCVARQLILPVWQSIGKNKKKHQVLPRAFMEEVDFIMATARDDVALHVMKTFMAQMPSLADMSANRVCCISTAIVAIYLNNRYNINYPGCRNPDFSKCLIVRDDKECTELQSYFPEPLNDEEVGALVQHWWKNLTLREIYKEMIMSTTLLHHLLGHCMRPEDTEQRSTKYTDTNERLWWWGVKQSAKPITHVLRTGVSGERRKMMEFSQEEISEIGQMSSANSMLWRTVIFPLSLEEIQCIDAEAVPLYVWLAKWYDVLHEQHQVDDTVFVERLINVLTHYTENPASRAVLNKAELLVILECLNISVNIPKKSLADLTSATSLIYLVIHQLTSFSANREIRQCVEHFGLELTKLYEAKVKSHIPLKESELKFMVRGHSIQSINDEKWWTGLFTAALIRRLQGMEEAHVLSACCSKMVQNYLENLPPEVSSEVERRSIAICNVYNFKDMEKVLFSIATNMQCDRNHLMKLVFAAGFKEESPQDIRKLILHEDFTAMIAFIVKLGLSNRPEQLEATCTYVENVLEQLISGHMLIEDLEFVVKYQSVLLKIMQSLLKKKWIWPANLSEWIGSVDDDGFDKKWKVLLALRDNELKCFRKRKEKMDVFISLLELIPPVSSDYQQMEPIQYLDQACNPLCAKESYNNDQKPEVIAYGEIDESMMQVITRLKSKDLDKIKPFQVIWIDLRKACIGESGDLYELQIKEVIQNVAEPALKQWDNLCQKIRRKAVTLGEIEKYFNHCLGNVIELRKLFNLLQVEGFEKLLQNYHRINLYTRAANTLMELRDQYHMDATLEELQQLQNWCHDKSVKLRDIDVDVHTLVPSQAFIDTFKTAEAVDCIDIFRKCHSLVEWIRRNIKSEKEVKILIDLAMSASGQEPIELQKASCLRSALSGYAPLIFGLDASLQFDDIIQTCHLVIVKLETEPNLPTKLNDSQRFLEWIKHVRSSSGSVEVDALSQIKEINESSTVLINFADTDQVKPRGLMVVLPDSKTEYDTDKLIDLQNRVMLVSNDDIETKAHVDTYQEVLQDALRLAELGREMLNIGCFLFQLCTVTLVRKRGQPAKILVSFDKTKVSHQRLETECLKAASNIFEKCKIEWVRYIDLVRNKFYFVNIFTNAQLKLLRKTFASWNRASSDTVEKTLLLLQCINPAIEREQIEENLERVALLDDMEVNIEWPQAPSSIRQFCTEMQTAAEGLCKRYNRSEQNCLSLWHVGQLLESIGICPKAAQHFDAVTGLTTGNPNLILCSPDDMITTVLSIYKRHLSTDQDGGTNTLPTDEEILFCTESTTFEEINLLWKRAFSLKGSTKVFCLVNADLVRFEVADSSIKIFDACRKENKDYQIVVVCNRTRQRLSHFVTCLEPFKRHIPPDESGKLKDFLLMHFKRAENYSDPNRSSVRLITSQRAGMGKSLKVKSLSSTCDHLMKVSITDVHTTEEDLADALMGNGLNLTTSGKKILVHLDLSHEVLKNIDMILFKLLYLGSLTTTEGYKWIKQPSHYYVIENVPRMKVTGNPNDDGEQSMIRHIRMLDLFPELECWSPGAVVHKKNVGTRSDQLINKTEFGKEEFQKPISYIKMLERNDVTFGLNNNRNDLEDLQIVLRHCGISNCAWSEVQGFLSFLYTQIKDCEQSVFCQIGSQDDSDLPGFGLFVVKFMLKMCQDFATRSLQLAENRGSKETGDVDNQFLDEMAVKRTWETSPHPYIFFNCDPKTRSRTTFSFMGFYVEKSSGNLQDPVSGATLEQNILTKQLFEGLERNNVNLSEEFDLKPRNAKIRTLCDIMGVESNTDPDVSFVLTTDNVKKILAIYMRFRCNIPVIIMGETGCGKTRLIKYMCDLQKPKAMKKVQNMITVKVHGGTSRKHICQAVGNALKLCKENRELCPGMETILFFDEANTTPCIGFLKEIICDRSMNGGDMDEPNLKIIAAVNPYRRHTPEMISKLQKAGLGYHVSSDETVDCLGNIPMRELVYRVQRLPERMLHMVWDFGQLNEQTEASYISEMVEKELSSKQRNGKDDWNSAMSRVIVDILQASQRYMRQQKDECKFVSLRDIERTLQVLKWFHAKRKPLFQDMDQKAKEKRIELLERKRIHIAHMTYEEPNSWTRALILTLGVCYYASLSDRKSYASFIEKKFVEPLKIPPTSDWIEEIERCQDVFMDNIVVPDTIAKNKALKENIFMMIVCIELRIPLFLVGRPGSSKSLAKAMVMDAMQGKMSASEFFRDLKEVQMISYQCSPLSTAEGIVNTFSQSAKLQEGNDLTKYTTVVVLDEVGLAEDSPHMPLKSLHALLEDGCEGTETPQPHQKVAFIGISNWALDPAKMNRGILVQRNVPKIKDLIKTARGICKSRDEVSIPLLKGLAESYDELQTHCEDKKEFFGLRDYYGLIKMVHAFSQKSHRPLSWNEIKYAVLRNFGGLTSVDPVQIFQKNVMATNEEFATDPDCSEMSLILDGVRGENLDLKDSASRYTLIMVESLGTLGILQTHFMEEKTIVLYGSSFPLDQDYSQICRNINKIKGYMAAGKKVVLLNLDNLYESLYDCLNQYYVELAGDKFVDLGLGNHRVKCRVDPEFRVSLLAETTTVYERYPVALINRLEKHFLSSTTILEENNARIVRELELWVQEFITVDDSDSIQPENVFIGYHQDAIGSVVLQTVHSLDKDIEDPKSRRKEIKEKAKEKLLQCATPDGILRLKLTKLNDDDKQLSQQYFLEQEHGTLENFLKKKISQTRDAQQHLFFQVTTHSRLMSHTEIESLCRKLNMQRIGSSKFRTLGKGQNISRAQGPAQAMNMKHMLLNKYDTEHQFRKDLREFSKDTVTTGLLLVQCEAGHLFQSLAACAQYIIWDEYQAMQDENKSFVILLILQIPRYAAQRFTGFHGGKWDSWHIDELQQDANNKVDIAKMQNKSVCELVRESVENPYSSAFDLDVMLVDMVHLACSRIIDLQGNMERKEARIYQLLHLLQSDDHTSFLKAFKTRMLKLLEDKYEFQKTIAVSQEFEKEWLYKRVCKINHITKSASLRSAVWKYIQEDLCPIVTGLIAYIDTHNNLDLAESAHRPLASLWTVLLSEDTVTDCSYTEKFLTKPSYKELQRHSVVSDLPSGKHFVASFPFSFTIGKLINKFIELDAKLNEGTSKGLLERVQDKIHAHPLGAILDEEKWQSAATMCKLYIHDFVHLFYTPSTTQDVEIEVIKNEIFRCLPTEDVVAVHVTYEHWKHRIDNFRALVAYEEGLSQRLQIQNKPTRTNPHFMLDTQALREMTVMYQPEITEVGFHNMEDWMRRVNDAIPLITTALLVAEKDVQNQTNPVPEQQELLKELGISWLRFSVVGIFADNTARDMSEVQQFWKNLPEGKHFTVIEVLNRAITTVTGTQARIVEKLLGKKFSSCAYCNNPVFEACCIKKCKHVYCHICIETASLQQEKCCVKNCKQLFQTSPMERFQKEKHVQAEEQVKTIKRNFQDFFIRVLLLCHHRPVEPAVINLLFDLVTSQGKPVPILCHRSEEDENFKLFLLKFLFNKCFEDTTKNVNDFVSLVMGEKKQTGRSVVHFLFCCLLQCIEDKLIIEGTLETEIVNWTHEMDIIANRLDTQDYVQQVNDVAVIRHIIRSVAAKIHHRKSDSCDAQQNDMITICLKQLKVFMESKKFPRHYLVRYIYKYYGHETLDAASVLDPWIFPEGKEDLKNDVFSMYGKQYRDCKKALLRDPAECQNKETLTRVLDAMHDKRQSHHIFILTLLRMVSLSKDALKHATKIKEVHGDAIKNLGMTHSQRAICENIMIVREAGNMTRAKLQIVELFEHFQAILALKNETLLAMLQQLTDTPAVFMESFLPSMPEDEIFKQISVIRQGESWKLIVYECPNGHPYTIGNCGQAVMEARCPECNAKIGAKSSHALRDDNKVHNMDDGTKTGHCINYPIPVSADNVSRFVHPVALFMTRLMLHLAMYGAAKVKPRDVARLLGSVKTADVNTILQEHIYRDLENIARIMKKNKDDSVFISHMMLHKLSQYDGNTKVASFTWKTKEGRIIWEEEFVRVAINPLIQDLDMKIAEAAQEIENEAKENAATLILNEILPDGQRINLKKVYTIPDMWKYKTHVGVEHLRLNVECLPPEENVEILKLFLKEESNLRLLKYLPDILELMTKLIKRFHLVINIKEINDLTIEEFLQGLEGIDEKALYEELVQKFSSTWMSLQSSLKRFGFQLEPKNPPLFVPEEHFRETFDIVTTPVSMLIPNVHGFGLCALALVHKLLDIHNNFVMKYHQIRDKKSVERALTSRSLTSAHTICYTVNSDLIPIIQAHAKVPIRYGSGFVIQYDYRGIQREIDSHFLVGKPVIKFKMTLIAYREHFTTDYAHLKKLETFVKQMSLPNKRRIQEECESLTLMEMNNALSQLDVAIVYLASLGLSGRDHGVTIVKYMSDTLKMTEVFPVANAKELQLGHAKYLWICISHERAKLLSLHNQNPFDDVNPKFREKQSPSARKILQKYFQQTTDNVDNILECLYEFILLHVAQEQNENDEDYVDQSGYPLGYSIEVFKDDTSYKGPRLDWRNFPEDITLAYTVDAWSTALQCSAL